MKTQLNKLTQVKDLTKVQLKELESLIKADITDASKDNVYHYLLYKARITIMHMVNDYNNKLSEINDEQAVEKWYNNLNKKI